MHILLALLAGLASACAFEPLGLWPLMPLGFAALILLLARAATLRAALGLGWAFGLGQFVVGLNWIATAFTYQAAMPAWLGWIAVVLLSAYLAVYPAMAAGLAWRYAFPAPSAGEGKAAPAAEGEGTAGFESPHPGAASRRLSLSRNGERDLWRLSLLLAAAWIVTEWLRATLFSGFAWNPVGVSLVDTPWRTSAPLIGTYGLSALAILLGGLVLAAARPGFARWQRGTLGLGLAAAAILGSALAGEGDARSPGKVIRIVQPNIGQENKHDPAFVQETYNRLALLSGVIRPEPRLILWPEAVIPDYLEDEPQPRAALAGLLGPADVLLTGGVAIERDAAGKAVAGRNSLFVLTPDARLRGRYDKAHLVPYGEYLPARPILSAIGLSRLVPGDLDFWPGPGPRTLPVPGFGRMGVQICYEIVFSGHVVDRANRPDFLFNPSNDAWFGRWGPPQHLAQARLRAIEEAMPVLRSTPTGISAVIDADGRLLSSLPWREQGAIDTSLPPPRGPTPFALAGNLLAFLFALLLGSLAFASLPRRR